jgi:two-component system chemotaxis response regulator CheB
MPHAEKIVVMGGSAGSLPALLHILQNLPAGFAIPVVVILHRLKNAPSELDKILNIKGGLQVREPEDKEAISPGYVYFAPANYHLLAEDDKTFSLDYSEPVQYSRPSIDVSFESVAAVYGAGTTGILLCGSNDDGAAGLRAVTDKGGVALVQRPDTCEYAAMPKAAISKNPAALIYAPSAILHYLERLNLQ